MNHAKIKPVFMKLYYPDIFSHSCYKVFLAFILLAGGFSKVQAQYFWMAY